MRPDHLREAKGEKSRLNKSATRTRRFGGSVVQMVPASSRMRALVFSFGPRRRPTALTSRPPQRLGYTDTPLPCATCRSLSISRSAGFCVVLWREEDTTTNDYCCLRPWGKRRLGWGEEHPPKQACRGSRCSSASATARTSIW